MCRRSILILFGLSLAFGCRKTDTAVRIPGDFVAAFPLDGTAEDTVNGNEGVLHGAVPCADRSGADGKAFYFPSADSVYIEFSHHESYSFETNVFSISGWILPGIASTPVCVFSKRNSTGPFEYSFDDHMTPGHLSFDNWISGGSTTVYGTDPLDATLPLSPGSWMHFAVVANGTVLRTYLNGALQPGADSVKTGNSFSVTDAPLRLGLGGGYGKQYYFEGAIDELYFYDRVLSPSEIETLAL